MADIFISNYADHQVVSAYIENKLEFLSVIHDSVLDNVYLCRVENVLNNIGSAFVRYQDNETGYVSLKNLAPECVINRLIESSSQIRTGDQIVLQVEAAPIKTKKAKLSSSIAIPGKYCVVTMGRKGVGASLKLPEDVRGRLVYGIKGRYQTLVESYSDKLGKRDFGIIIRTDAMDLDPLEAEDIITADISSCLDQIADIMGAARSRTLFSCLYRSSFSDVDFHIEKAKAFLKSRHIEEYGVLTESIIYDLKRDIEKLLYNRVWLKSGAFLVIEQLESFNAIDVNTGKAITGKKDITAKVNLESAEEIFRQIRLRNLTGMILIDFINMKADQDNENLCDAVKRLASKDPVHTEFIDITGLGIIELTRNKNDKSLKEILQNHNETVDNAENGC